MTSWLWWSSAGLLACAALVVLAAVWMPYAQDEAQGPASARPSKPHDAEQGKTDELPPATDAVWRTPLRMALVDAPAPPVTVSAAPLGARLEGTFIEPGRSVAVFITRNGETKLACVGDQVEGAQVLDITPQRVSVQHNGRRVELVLDKKGGL